MKNYMSFHYFAKTFHECESLFKEFSLDMVKWMLSPREADTASCDHQIKTSRTAPHTYSEDISNICVNNAKRLLVSDDDDDDDAYIVSKANRVHTLQFNVNVLKRMSGIYTQLFNISNHMI